jgi:hypothetical protein
LNPKLSRHFANSLRAKVIDSYQLRSRNPLQPTRVFLAVLTYADHGHRNALAHSLPRGKQKSEIRNWKIEMGK